MNKKPFIEILGAGPAGLSAGYFASNADIPIRIFEGTNKIEVIAELSMMGNSAMTQELTGFMISKRT